MTWPMVALGEVAKVVGGATPKSSVAEYWDGDVKWVTPKDLSDLRGKYISDTPRKISTLGLSKCAAEILPENSVLFSSRAPIGLVAINKEPMATNQGFKSFVPGTHVNPDFLYWWLKANRRTLLSKGNGATFKELSKAIVQGIEIPLPPLSEQKRIAAILDKADAILRLRQQALTRVNDLSQAIFYEMFGDPAINSKDWALGTVGDLLHEVKYGTSAKANTDKRGLPILRMGNITYDGHLDLTDLKHIELSGKDFYKYTTQPGDILFNRTNSKELVGKAAVITKKEPFAIAGYLIRGRANEQGNTQYISGYLNSRHGKTTLRNMCKNIVGMANINAKEFQSIRLALPPVKLQNEYATRLACLRRFRSKLEKSLHIETTLFASLQQRAFRGEL